MPDPSQALPNRLKFMLIAALKELDLDRIGDHVYGQMVAEDATNTPKPCLLVSEEGLTEQYLFGTTGQQDWEWPFNVFLVDVVGVKQHEKAAAYRDWRTTLFNALNEQHYPGPLVLVPELYWCLVDLRRPAIEPQLGDLLKVMSGLTVKFWTRQPRTGPGLQQR